MLYIAFSSQQDLVDNVKMHERLGKIDHNQIHFDINVKSESKKNVQEKFQKNNYKDMRTYVAKLDCNNMLRNKTAIDCWSILKYEIEQKLACNINNYSNSFYSYIKSKRTVRDKVGPIEDSVGNIVSRWILLLKLNAYGIGDGIINWIEQWLTGRRQRVVVGGEVSNWKPVLSGVPQ